MFPYSAVCTALYVAKTWKEACYVMLCSKPLNFQELPKYYFDKHETDHLCILQSMVKKKKQISIHILLNCSCKSRIITQKTLLELPMNILTLCDKTPYSLFVAFKILPYSYHYYCIIFFDLQYSSATSFLGSY